MRREEIVHTPESTGSVRNLGPVDVPSLIQSLQPFVDLAQTGVTQQGLRWAGEFEGVGDLRYSEVNPRKISESDFKNWISGTELLQQVAKSFNVREEGRVRMLMMKPKTTYSLHFDADLWRLHIPLITNPDAFMVVDGKLWHMPIGSAYLVKVKDHHLALNAGNENRIHIVFDYCANLA